MREVHGAARAVTSLDKPIGEGESGAYGDLFAADGHTPAEEVEVRLTEDALHRAVDALPDARSAWSCCCATASTATASRSTLDEIGRVIGVSRERVRQIEAEALRELAELRELEGLAPAYAV